MLTLQILGLIGLLLISLPLGRAKERARAPWMKWIPSLRFARLVLLDLLGLQQRRCWARCYFLHFQ